MKRAFLDKILARLRRIQPEEVETFFVELARDKRFLETIFNAIHEGVIVTDVGGTVVYLNDAACLLFGLDPASALGRPLAEKISGLRWKELAQGREIVSRDIEVFHPAHRVLNFYVVPLMSEDEEEGGPQQHAGYVLIMRDITERQRATEETLESERMAALQLLAAGVAHEIGNPLNSLTIHLQLLERRLRKLPADQRGDLLPPLAIARDEIKRLDTIVTQFLRAIRPAPLDRVPQDLNLLVREAAEFLGPELKSRNVLLELELSPGLPALAVDPNQLKQAFFNIIKNSSEAMKQGGLLKIRTLAEAGRIDVSFTDTGGGMSTEAMARVFEPYYTTKRTGSGLGLMITQRIVRAHGGEVVIESTPGQGLRLTIRLPRQDRQVQMLPPRPLTLPAPAKKSSRRTPDQPGREGVIGGNA
ncbi:MAG: two-component system sensor histidine kinase NtrB [Chthoniobacterales bacterium]|jgi:PAS domain S-box-containing protein